MENKKYKVFIGPNLYRAKMVGQFDEVREAYGALLQAARDMGYVISPALGMHEDRGCIVVDFGSWHDFGYVFGDKLL